jgi:hypothetical protein
MNSGQFVTKVTAAGPDVGSKSLSNIHFIIYNLVSSTRTTGGPRSNKTASFTGRFRTVNDEKTASLRP